MLNALIYYHGIRSINMPQYKSGIQIKNNTLLIGMKCFLMNIHIDKINIKKYGVHKNIYI